MLSERIHHLASRCFDETDREAAIELLATRCGANLPMVDENVVLIERIQTGVLKLSSGSIEKLRIWITEANDDWREVLDAAGFYADPTAHQTWQP